MEEKSSTSLSNGQQQFNLRWNNHTNNILQVFTEQLANEALIDVTLACEGQFIKAHKMILSACSPYFQELFRIHTVPHPVIIINGMKYTDVKQVIDFMYRGEVKVLEAELDSLLAVAESLQVKGLCTVRNNYEKNDTSNEQLNNNDTATSDHDNNLGRQTKKRKISAEEETFTKTENLSDDESLSSTIKIEPPEIKDIDQEDDKSCKTTEFVYDQQTSKPLKTTKSGRLVRPKNLEIESYPSPPSKVPKFQPTNVQTVQTVVETTKNKIPRPPNAFMIFANEWRRKLAAEYPKESNKEISVRLGVMWKNLSSDAKENYYSASRKADEEHKIKYPGYYYSPKEARLRKNKKESMVLNKCKKNCDAMRYVKLVMKENDTDRWRTEQSNDEDESAEEVSVNVHDDIDVEDPNAEESIVDSSDVKE